MLTRLGLCSLLVVTTQLVCRCAASEVACPWPPRKQIFQAHLPPQQRLSGATACSCQQPLAGCIY